MSYITLKHSFSLLSRPVSPTPESDANLNLDKEATADDDTLHNKARSTTLTSSSDAEPLVPYPR